MSNRVLIIGASGFIGNTIYKELLPYFDIYGTYANQEELYGDNQVFFKYKVEENSIEEIISTVKPAFIISAFKGPFNEQYKMHKVLCDYALKANCKLIYISSSSVFDAKSEFPSYEFDTPLAESSDGKQKVLIEKLMRHLPKNNYAIIRLPMVLGVTSPTIIQLKQAIKHKATFEVFPNLIVSATTQNKLAQQIHYIINKNLSGIFHLSSKDVIHHNELFEDISEKLNHKKPIFKSVFSSNEDQYLAILPKINVLPKNYHISIEEVIADSVLKDEIETLKTL